MPTVMIVDDDESFRRALSVRLRAAGFHLLKADHPESAVHTVLSERPDLILLDIDMPHFSGLDFHECLHVSDRARNIPVVYLSGSATPPNRQAAFRLGARAFIAKPYDPDELLATIRGLLEASNSAGLAGSARHRPIIAGPQIRPTIPTL